MNSSSKSGRRSSGSACSVGRAPVPETQSKKGSSPVSTWMYVVAHASTPEGVKAALAHPEVASVLVPPERRDLLDLDLTALTYE